MAFAKGHKKTGGRQPGATNKTTHELREMIFSFLTNKFEEVINDFDKLPPKERTKLYCDLLQYGLPKLQNVSMQTNVKVTPPVIIDWSGLTDSEVSKYVEEHSKIN